MKTHELAKALNSLAQALKRSPNVDLDRITLSLDQGSGADDKASMTIGISTLTSLSKIAKGQWIEFIHEHRLPIKFRQRDATRDIIGKILVYLEKDTSAQRRIKESIKAQATKSSAELSKALSLLLQDKE